MITLKEYAKQNNISYRTAQRHFHAGQIPGAIQLPTKTIRVPADYQKLANVDWNVVLYARSIDGTKKWDLDTQISALENFTNHQGWLIKDRITESRSRLEESELCSYDFTEIDRLVILNMSILGQASQWMNAVKPDFIFEVDPDLSIVEPIYADVKFMIEYLISRGIPAKKAKLLIKAVK